jgi:putative ABC transport system permease protein
MFLNLRQMLRDIRGQKLRTFLTVLGIVWGTVAVSLLLAFGKGFHHELRRQSAGLGRGIVIAFPSRTSMPFEGLGKGRRVPMTYRDVELLRQRCTTLGLISGEYGRDMKLQWRDSVLSVNVRGVEPPFAEMRNVISAEGSRFLNAIDQERRRRVIFLGFELAEDLFGEVDPVGNMLTVDGLPFLVVGVMQEKDQNSNYAGPDSSKAFIPESTFRTITGYRYLHNFVYTAKDVTQTEAAIREVRQVMASRHRFHPDDEEAFLTWDTTEGARFLEAFFTAFRVFLAVVGVLTLVVGGIGVSNIMNVVVEERTREVGIKMSLGARPRAVLAQFLVETVMITAVGGAIGLALTYGICEVFPSLGLQEVGKPELSPGLALGTVALLGLIGLLAGYFPARTAANLDPVVAMKL